MVYLGVEEVGKGMLNTTTRGGRGTRLVVAAIITLLLALAALTAQASPASAQGETLTVTRTGVGTVASDPAGIDCGTDCSEPYPSSEQEICIPDRGCTTRTVHQTVTLTAAPAPGWAFQAWGGACSGTATTCTLSMLGDRTVDAAFTRISPPNDDFAAAQPISGTSASVNGTTKDATREDPGEPRHSAGWTGEHTVWYSWTAPHTGDWNMDTCQANIDSILAVYTGGQIDALTKIKDENNGCTSGFGSKLTFRATSGTTYRIMVGDAGGAMQNNFTLALAAIPAPSNDNFANAAPINGTSASVNGTNVSATRESSDPWVGTTNAERSVWYQWTAPFSGSATLDTCTTNYDTLLSVYAGRFGFIDSANNGCSSGFGDKLSFAAVKGQTYHIGVDGCCGAPAGTFTLALGLVDNEAPETTIHGGPQDGSATSDTSVTFAFDADEPDSTFKCRVYRSDLNAPAFGDCSNAGMHTEAGLAQGTYTFEVRATDTAGNSDATPAKRTFSVETTRPTVESWSPRGKKVRPTAKPTVTFSERMNEGSVEANANGRPTAFVLKKGTAVIPATVSYTEDGTTFRAVLSPTKRLKAGAKYAATVTAAATDEAGNALVAKSWTFTVRR
jgi:hypothetical protein